MDAATPSAVVQSRAVPLPRGGWERSALKHYAPWTGCTRPLQGRRPVAFRRPHWRWPISTGRSIWRPHRASRPNACGRYRARRDA